MFVVENKKTGKSYCVFNVKDDKNGYPYFLIYVGRAWKWISAKNFKPVDTADFNDNYKCNNPTNICKDTFVPHLQQYTEGLGTTDYLGKIGEHTDCVDIFNNVIFVGDIIELIKDECHKVSTVTTGFVVNKWGMICVKCGGEFIAIDDLDKTCYIIKRDSYTDVSNKTLICDVMFVSEDN